MAVVESELKVYGGDRKMVMSILDTTGDTKVMWDPRDADEVAAAKASFDRLVAKGFRAFKVSKKGEPGQRIEAFEPGAEKIILIPQMAGG